MSERAFSPNELALLEAIQANPRDDSHRLAYPDWLEQHQELDYAEFIRLQCACLLDVFRPGHRRRGSWLVGPEARSTYPPAWQEKLTQLVNAVRRPIPRAL